MSLLIDLLQAISMFALLILVLFGSVYAMWLLVKCFFIIIQSLVNITLLGHSIQEVPHQLIKPFVKNILPLFLAMLTMTFNVSVKNMVMTSIIITSMFGVAGLFAASAVIVKIVAKIKKYRHKIKKWVSC